MKHKWISQWRLVSTSPNSWFWRRVAVRGNRSTSLDWYYVNGPDIRITHDSDSQDEPVT